MRVKKAAITSGMLWISAILLGAGIAAPCMTIYPSYGEFTSVLTTLLPELKEPIAYSILESVQVLFSGGQYLVALVILIFSIVFPVFKLGVLWDASLQVKKGRVPEGEMRLVAKLGKYSMLDIFVLALIVVAVKGLPGGTAVVLEWGVYAFGVSIFLSMFLPGMIIPTRPDNF